MILDYLTKHKKAFQERYNIEKIGLFGSYARGEAYEKSDIDILYSLKDGTKLTFDDYIEFENVLKKAFETDIDLINSKKLNPLIKIEAKKDFIYV